MIVVIGYHRRASCDKTRHWLKKCRNSKGATHHWLKITNTLLAVPGSCVCLCMHNVSVSVCVIMCVYPKPKATRPAATITVTDVKELGRLRKRSAPGTTSARALNQYGTHAHVRLSAHRNTHKVVWDKHLHRNQRTDMNNTKRKENTYSTTQHKKCKRANVATAFT